MPKRRSKQNAFSARQKVQRPHRQAKQGGFQGDFESHLDEARNTGEERRNEESRHDEPPLRRFERRGGTDFWICASCSALSASSSTNRKTRSSADPPNNRPRKLRSALRCACVRSTAGR